MKKRNAAEAPAIDRANVIDWIATGEQGASSKCMAMWLAFGKRTDYPAYPHDPDDLDRCLKLLSVAPGLRKRLHLMAELSPTWAALVENWADIEAMHIGEVGLGWTKARTAPRTYELMRRVIKSGQSLAAI